MFTSRLPSASGELRASSREAHRQRIGSFADVDRRDRRLADAGLNDVLHIRHVDAVAGGLFTIQLDLHLRDRRLLKDRGAGGALNAVQHSRRSDAPMLRSSFEIIAVDLGHQRTVRAADHVVDAVDDGLTDADRIAGQVLG